MMTNVLKLYYCFNRPSSEKNYTSLIRIKKNMINTIQKFQTL